MYSANCAPSLIATSVSTSVESEIKTVKTVVVVVEENQEEKPDVEENHFDDGVLKVPCIVCFVPCVGLADKSKKKLNL